jgi:hypothetical protein
MSSTPTTEERLQAAKTDYINGSAASIIAAAKNHHVNEWTLRARLKGVAPRSDRLVNGKKMDDDLEQGLLLYIEKMDRIGFPI